MKTRLVLICYCLLAAGAASACIDPDPDQMGIYFDPGATIYCTHAAIGCSIDLYFVYTRPTLEIYQGYEFGMSIEGGLGELIWNCGSIIFIVPPDPDNVKMQLCAPLPTETATVLVRATYLYLDATGGPVSFYLQGAREFSTGNPALPGIYFPLENDEMGVLPVGTSTEFGTVAAQINGDCVVVETESETWGGLKSLYR